MYFIKKKKSLNPNKGHFVPRFEKYRAEINWIS